jgi:hypothetical protein
MHETASSKKILVRADMRRTPGCIGLEADGVVYEFSGASHQSLTTLVRYADGTRSLEELKQIAGGRTDLFALSDVLVAEGLAKYICPSAHGNILPHEFTAVCRELFPLWKARLFAGSLWTGLALGTLPRSVFLGWLLESYHFIEGANLRLPYAAAYCFNGAARDTFAHHYAEEWDHGKYYLAALAAEGFAEGDVLECEPIPATTAVTNHMRRCARVDPLSYAVCSGFLESTGEDRSAGRKFLTLLDQHYSAGRSIAEPLLAHLELDEAYGHNGLLEDTCKFFGELTVTRAAAALDSGFRLVETLEYWSDSIMECYNNPNHAILPDMSRSIAATMIGEYQ